jgi:hypothetical protein
MFHPNRTVFILGAGASWHYGYPTGESLTKKVIKQADIVSRCLTMAIERINYTIAHIPLFISENIASAENGVAGVRDAYRKTKEDADMIGERLRAVDPLVIDFFLGQNRDLADLGKLLISLVLLECEANDLSGGGNQNRKELLSQSPYEGERARTKGLELKQFDDNWYRFLIHKLVYNCEGAADLLSNKVTFITFNYDVSLEYHLHRGLHSIQLFAHSDELAEFFSPSRFIHIYGKIRDDVVLTPLQFSSEPLSRLKSEIRGDIHAYWEEVKRTLDAGYKASKGIKVMAPGKIIPDAAVMSAQAAIDNADCVYILGYGFDPANSALLDLPTLINEKKRKTILFTNFGGYYSVNKRASRVIFGRPDVLMQRDVVPGDDALGVPLCEKSLQDVYHALAYDFDNVEEHLLPTTNV